MTDRKVALVTGGARGIGRAIAYDLARDHRVVAVRNTSPGEGLPEEIHLMTADLAAVGSCKEVVAEVIDRFGRLDVIVNNAAVMAETPREGFKGEDWRRIFDVNVMVPADLLSTALPHLKPGAAIVNVSSVNAALPPRGAVAYGASKAALELWTKGMAKELGAKGIRVNAVAPGAINIPEAPRSKELTDLFVAETALGRIGVPEDIARAVRFLAGDAAGFITGEVLTVSGGYRL
ncbi:SDR family oxidoreductase [Alisedimentitalea sp. MJ-SS2]|uniref:SDR family NAD(P)-dependent oxidoreductase n=1 Tax=Aliisedimentitalea sp. MJ-SS2 TaxID=3049795 RepID=UPI00291315F8|nr:SDR family oxidoreductase [Alisedimentitalea sp. MJ-SS2]MDU8929864.1 SDR family oxidoreductase [Alisedimentitalea sp. MJ-SS2]